MLINIPLPPIDSDRINQQDQTLYIRKKEKTFNSGIF